MSDIFQVETNFMFWFVLIVVGIMLVIYWINKRR